MPLCQNEILSTSSESRRWSTLFILSILELLVKSLSRQEAILLLYSVCNFQSMKSPVELNSLFLTFFCYITWFKEARKWTPCKRDFYIKYYGFFETIA